MSGRKNVLKQYQIITAGNMASASLTSTVTNIGHMDNIGLQFNFTGSPVGTFAVQVSADYNQDNEGNVINAGNWIPLTLSPAPTAGGSAGQIYIDINQTSAPWIRMVYTKTSGTGALDAYITGKML